MEVITNANGYVVTEDVKAAPKYKAVGNVYQTKDYSIFKGLPNNRPVDPKNVQAIIANMEKFGILVLPIIVNEHFEIVDGQHRFEAIKHLGGSILFLIAKGYGDTQIQALNTISKKWTRKDYIEYYAAKGLQAFADLSSLMSEFPRFPASSVITSYVGKRTLISKRLKEGTLPVESRELAREYILELVALSEFYPWSHQASFLYAYVNIRRNKEEFNPKIYLSKVKKHATNSPVFARVEQARDYIEHMYNYKSHKKINLRF